MEIESYSLALIMHQQVKACERNEIEFVHWAVNVGDLSASCLNYLLQTERAP